MAVMTRISLPFDLLTVARGSFEPGVWDLVLPVDINIHVMFEMVFVSKQLGIW